MTVDDLVSNPPRLHIGPDGTPAGYAVSAGVLRYLDTVLESGQCTLETGAGVSTILFAMKGTRHTSIAPAAPLFERIRACLAESGLPGDGITLVNERSEAYLPSLECEPLDLVLIDGRHAFPSPFIDWYYTEPHLKVGGLLLVDDTPIWTGRVLRDFLREAPEWESVTDIEGRTAVFRKLADGGHQKFWPDQPFVVRRSNSTWPRVQAVASALLHGRLGELRDMAHRYRANRRRQ